MTSHYFRSRIKGGWKVDPCLYGMILMNLYSKNEVIEDLKRFSNDIDKIVLLCYEKPNDFCHRHLVSNWLHDVIDIKEYNK